MNFKELLDIKLIENVDMKKTFNKFHLCSDFYESPGNQHYQLLAYLSSLFNNANIIEIGTHVGESAVALSYNKNNTIYTFDIIDKVSSEKKEINNIHFIIDDIMTSVESRNKWKEIVLSSAFIFLDVDPHNGLMEYDFYLFLKENHYKGIVVCDDIWYFKDMRDNFWYRIPYNYRYDISHFGHWSGTGIITFNENIKFHKNDNSDWTLVTAYFNLTKCPDASEEICKRDKSYYFSHSISTLSLPYNLVIYCDNESYNEISNIRPNYLKDKTIYVIIDFDDISLNGKQFNNYRNIINENRLKHPYYFDNRNTASYYLFCMSRYIMLKETIELNPFNSQYFSWINFCIERMGYNNLKYLDEALAVKRDKFSTCYIDYIPYDLIQNVNEYFKWGRCSMCSGFFTGNKEYMNKVCDLILKKFLYYLSLGYGHADEQLYSPVYFENVDLFHHYYGDYQQMITNYKYIYDAPENPIRNFISNSFKYENYIKCIECCEFILKSLCYKKCILNKDNVDFLMEKYIMSKLNIGFYINKELCPFDIDIEYAYVKIIKPLLDAGKNKECYENCEKILDYIDKNATSNNKYWFMIYFSYYVSSFYFKRERSEEIVNNIFLLCKNNIHFKTEYKNNKEFYDNQFKFVNYNKSNTKLAYYTFFFGGNNNYSFLIPPVPSKEYDCYYFTNNKDIFNALQKTSFISIFIDNIPIYNDHNKDSMSYKIYRCNPFDIELLKTYDYICWFDNKIFLHDDLIEKVVYELDNMNKSIVFTRHPYFEKYNSIWDEFNLSMNTEKYKNEETFQINYINKMITNGYKIDDKDGYLCAGLNIRKNDEIAKKFGVEWFNNILECGIQDQIALYFISQDYKKYIKITEYQSLWRYFYE